MLNDAVAIVLARTISVFTLPDAPSGPDAILEASLSFVAIFAGSMR